MTADWQRGYDLEELKAIASRFTEAEEGRVFGRFTRCSEAWVAERLANGQLLLSDEAAVAVKQLRGRSTWQAHSVGPVAAFGPGDVIVERGVGPAAFRRELLADAELVPTGIQAYLPDPAAAELAELYGLDRVGAKVPAGSEVVGMWAAPGNAAGRPPTALEELNAVLVADYDPSALEPGLAALRSLVADWPQHYSSYNKRRSWTAVSLRGFSDDGAFVEKPAEMSKGWKREHPGWEEMGVTDTAYRALFEPAITKLLQRLGINSAERVRLMQLAPGDGELTRHADITDRDAGFSPGRLARLHVPIETNPGVQFQVWSLRSGLGEQFHMPAGSVWALDHSKPHAAVNEGDSFRVHLVIDAPVEGVLAERMRFAAADE